MYILPKDYPHYKINIDKKIFKISSKYRINIIYNMRKINFQLEKYIDSQRIRYIHQIDDLIKKD